MAMNFHAVLPRQAKVPAQTAELTANTQNNRVSPLQEDTRLLFTYTFVFFQHFMPQSRSRSAAAVSMPMSAIFQ